jgi:ParB/RepB/Spo0J family partition protein
MTGSNAADAGEIATLQRFLDRKFQVEPVEERSSEEIEDLQRFLDRKLQVVPDTSGENEERSNVIKLPILPTEPVPPGTEPTVSSHLDRGAVAQIRGRQAIIDGARARLNKQATERRQRQEEERNGPQGEKRSERLTRIEMVPLEAIEDDPTFHNQRLTMDEEKLQELSQSMMSEGLKVPITVIEMPGDRLVFHIRAGFRRTVAARRLNWKRIPAIILPSDTPTSDEYWTNIVENSARTDLSSYEVASSAKMMRDKFHVSSSEFSSRSGYSVGHIDNLLRCLDHLPDAVLEQWKAQARIPLRYYIQWASLSPAEAVSAMCRYAHQNPQVSLGWTTPHRATSPLPSLTSKPKKRGSRLAMASPSGLKRMQKARLFFEMNPKIERRERIFALHLIDFCSGGRDNIPGYYSEKDKLKSPERPRGMNLMNMPDDESNLPPPSDDE